MIEKDVKVKQEIIFRVIEIPERIVVEKPFQALCRIINRSDMKTNLSLVFDESKSGGVLLNGISGMTITDVEAHKELSVPISFFPVRTGIQTISGLGVATQQQPERPTLIEPFDVLVDSSG